jgi:hypothetical protein
MPKDSYIPTQIVLIYIIGRHGRKIQKRKQEVMKHLDGISGMSNAATRSKISIQTLG